MNRTDGSIEAKLSILYRRQQGIRPVKVPSQFCWHRKAEEDLMALFLEGHSNRNIAVRMNGPTQGSVSSKIRSLQMLGRLPKKSNGTASFYFGKATPVLRVSAEIGLLERDSCRYPIGDLEDPEFHFCKKPRRDALTSYCAEHHAVCWEVRHVRNRRRFT